MCFSFNVKAELKRITDPGISKKLWNSHCFYNWQETGYKVLNSLMIDLESILVYKEKNQKFCAVLGFGRSLIVTIHVEDIQYYEFEDNVDLWELLLKQPTLLQLYCEKKDSEIMVTEKVSKQKCSCVIL